MTPQDLTPAQRRALLWLPADGDWKHLDDDKAPTCIAVFYRLFYKELVQRLWRNEGVWHLTPAGIALRAQIEKASKE